MKKNSFVEGTVIATLSLVLVKILGMLYVIPFYAIVGTTGAALYAYAYNIYSLFLDISTAGIPSAVSKIINEFNTLGKQEAKIRTFEIGKKLLGFIAIIAFILMFVFAKPIATLIIGDMTGGNTIQDVTFVLRCVSFALLVFPFLSVTRGFFQGHNVIYVSSISQIIEQLIRVAIIICGSYIALKWLNLDLRFGVGVAIFGAFFGGLSAYLYVHHVLTKNKKEFSLTKEFTKKDDVTNKDIIKRIIKYSIPVIIISVANAIYNNVDMILILKTMYKIGYSVQDVEFIATALSTWSLKISVIVISMSGGLVASLIPHIVESFTLKNYQDVNDKFNKSMQIMLFVSTPMCVGISLLSSSIWTIFYGHNPIGTSILAISIFVALFSNLYAVATYTLQSMNKYKMVYISSFTGLGLNIILDIPLILLFHAIGIPAYFGAPVATAIGYSSTVVITMLTLKKEYNFHYGSILKAFNKMILPLALMILVVGVMVYFIPVPYTSRLLCVGYISVISIVGALVFFVISHKMHLIDEILGENYLVSLKNKIFRKKVK